MWYSSHMENKKIEFKESDGGVPIIELGEYGRLQFSKITSHPDKGYKYLCYMNNYVDTVSIKGQDRSKTLSIPTNDSYTTNMKLERNARLKKGLPYGTIPQRLKDYLKKTLRKYLNDGYFPYFCIQELKDEIDGQEIEPILDEVQKKRKKQTKKR